MPRSAALATSEPAQEVAQEVLGDGGTALGAALGGFFAAAGKDAGVLFAPMTVLVGGLGSGVFAYDGRHRQPGRDAKRPRGFQVGEPVPAQARVSVPGAVFAAAVACAYHPGATILSCARRGVSRAKAEGQKERAALLELVATKGGLALSEPTVKKAFVSQFGLVEEGLVTPGDLVAPEGLQERAVEDNGVWRAPWSGDSKGGNSELVLAADAQGLFAAVAYSPLESGSLLEPYRVLTPSSAEPVMRGVTRVSPGAALPYGCPLEISRRDGLEAIQATVEGVLYQLARTADSREIIVRQK